MKPLRPVNLRARRSRPSAVQGKRYGGDRDVRRHPAVEQLRRAGSCHRVGRFGGLGPFGTFDTAGNLREWCWNGSGEKRYILGGAWDNTKSLDTFPDARLPFDRFRPTNGFRCATYANPPSQDLTEPIDLLRFLENQPGVFRFRDRRGETPVGEAVTQVYRSIHAYDRGELEATVESADGTPASWRKEKVSFRARAYGSEGLTAYLFLPKNAVPPFQAVIHFLGRMPSTFEAAGNSRMWTFDFIVRSGRAVLHPIFQGAFTTFESVARSRRTSHSPTSGGKWLFNGTRTSGGQSTIWKPVPTSTGRGSRTRASAWARPRAPG